jgi:hypothetical protein
MLLIVFVLLISFGGSSVYGSSVLEEFSGMYTPNIRKTGSAEDFSAAWIITTDRFLASKPLLDASSNMAGVSFAITRAKCTGCFPMLSRDYFDFLVEHLSTTSNQIPISNKNIFGIYYHRAKSVVARLKDLAVKRTESDIRLNQTVATLIYSSITFSRPQANLQSSIRVPYFEATFWSVYRYIPNIVVFVATNKDRRAVENMALPTLMIKQLLVPRDNKNRTVALPRMSLSWMDAKLRGLQDSASAAGATAAGGGGAGRRALGEEEDSSSYSNSVSDNERDRDEVRMGMQQGQVQQQRRRRELRPQVDMTDYVGWKKIITADSQLQQQGASDGGDVPAAIKAQRAKHERVERFFNWAQFKYVFFSEGDQILHMRQATGLYDTVDAGRGRIAIVPHRMQVHALLFILTASVCVTSQSINSCGVR